MLEVLELGTDGVLLKTSDIDEIMKTIAIVKPEALKLELSIAKILSTKPISTGARVCVDTCDMMVEGEGMLVGSQSAGLFLVEAEVHENPYVASRPFRVNAGSVSMYTLGSLQTTRYLSELKAGDEVIIINREGKTRKANVGRIKIEIQTAHPCRSRSGRQKNQNNTSKRRNHTSGYTESFKTSNRTKTKR